MVRDGLGNIAGCTPYGERQQKIPVAGGFIDIQAFSDLDPRFPRAIRKMYKVTDGKPVGHHVFICTDMLLSPTCRIFTPDAFADVTKMRTTHYAVSLTGSGLTGEGDLQLKYYNASTVGDVATGQYANEVRHSFGIIREAWLDTHYPGWLDRYRTGEAIGMDDVQLANTVLPKAALAEVVSAPLPALLGSDPPY